MAQVAGRVSGSGPPNIFTTLGRHPRLFRAWLRYSAHLMPFGLLPRRDTELVILRVAWQCRSAYEWQQHVLARASRGVDAGRDRGRAPETLLRAPSPSASGRCWPSATRCSPGGALSDATWNAVRASLRDREAIELCLLVGHYQGLASTLGALGIQVEPGPQA